MTKTVLVPLAEGFEEMEAVIIIDVLRRAGLDVTVAGLAGTGPVLGSRGISVVAEADLADVHDGTFDAVVLPGGLGGTHAMRDDKRVVDKVRGQVADGRLTAAICAAPLVLAAAELTEGTALTAHPSVHDELRESGAQVSLERLVRDGVILTSQGPGTAIEFALAVAAELTTPEAAAKLSAAMCT